MIDRFLSHLIKCTSFFPQAVHAIKSGKKIFLQVCPKLWNKCADDFTIFQAMEKNVRCVACTARGGDSDGINGILAADSERLSEGCRTLLRQNWNN